VEKEKNVKIRSSISLNVYGNHRVITPVNSLPQSANALINDDKILNDNEILINVDFLMLDSTSMKQIRESCKNNEKKMIKMINEIVAKRGKMHNPVTNSGGVMLGSIKEIGKKFVEKKLENANIKIGDKIIPVASLSALPLKIKKIIKIDGDRVYIEGTAVAFSCMSIFKIPKDISDELALALVDISSLVPQIKRTIREIVAKKSKDEDIDILVLGLGKAGITSLYCIKELEKELERNFNKLAVDFSNEQIEQMFRAIPLL
jgi:L-erythro-3,5-diaminohexanoate dehydrogenase